MSGIYVIRFLPSEGTPHFWGGEGEDGMEHCDKVQAFKDRKTAETTVELIKHLYLKKDPDLSVVEEQEGKVTLLDSHTQITTMISVEEIAIN